MSFYRSVICPDPRFASPGRCSDIGMLEPVTRAKCLAVIDDARDHGLMLMVWETYRSRARQGVLFERGASGLRGVGVHHFGLAFDLVRDVGGDPSWKGDFSVLGELALSHGLIWGGTFARKDSVHLQRCALKDQAGLFRGEFYPDESYVP